MKNVLLIASDLGNGGAERSISLLSYYLQEYYQVTLCILSGKDREQFYKTCDEIVFIDPPDFHNSVGKIKSWKYRLAALKKLKQDKNIDVSISFLEGPDYANIWTKGKEKVVLSIRGSKIYDEEIAGAGGYVRKNILIPRLYKKADKIVCVTEALRNELINHFGIKKDKTLTIYNFYEKEKIIGNALQDLTEDENRIFKKPVIISCGRLHIAKEFDKLIRIFVDLKAKVNVRLMILGEGDLLEQLKELCIHFYLKPVIWNGVYEEGDVYFMGFQKNVFKFYARSSLFALTSSWEGFPNVLAEALMCKLPVVTTDCYTGPREILNLTLPTDKATTEKIETPVGALLPLVKNLNDEIKKIWVDAIYEQLQKSLPPDEAFDDLTNRFTIEDMLQNWRKLIES